MVDQLQAGFVLSGLRDYFRKHKGARWENALRHLSVFEFETIGEGAASREWKGEDPIFAVASNLISRGLPTLPSLRVERAIAQEAGLTEEAEVSLGSIDFPLVERPSEKDEALLRRSLAPIDPSTDAGQALEGKRDLLGSGQEGAFLARALSGAVGQFAPQLAQPQRPMSSLVRPRDRSGFKAQDVDFAFEWPGLSASGEAERLIVEIDGSQHSEAGQRRLDWKRASAAARRFGTKTVRIPADATLCLPAGAKQAIQDFFEHPFARALAENYEDPLWNSGRGAAWVKAVLGPLLVARVQKTLVHLVREGVLDPEAQVWKIAAIERDVPGVRLATEDFRELMANLFQLEGEGRSLPEIDLRVYRPIEAPPLAFRSERKHEGQSLEEAGPFEADVVLDLSILQRPNLSAPEETFLERVGRPRSPVVCTVRSSYAPTEAPRVAGGRPISYKVPAETDGEPVGPGDRPGDSQIDPLIYFLQHLFRKEGFRRKQVDVLRHTLRGRSAIGLLPTGAGKSLTYQLSALLQPGVALVVAPLKSLMQDQNASLHKAGITRTAFINSSLSGPERRRVQERMTEGTYQFVFVSPERFQIQEFRERLDNMEVPFSYCVVDEAHCVSEWGHDFRTAYLRLGRNVRAHCRSGWGELPIIALTGTASFDVLADVRRELQFDESTATIKPETFEREELTFEIVPVSIPELPADAGAWDIKKAVMEQKKAKLADLLQEIPQRMNGQGNGRRYARGDRPALGDGAATGDGASSGSASSRDFFALDGDETNSGLIFTPHANGDYGVRSVAGAVRSVSPALRGGTGCYASSEDRTDDDDLMRIQEEYKENELSALVATKAFGMGIDKPNIRYVVHMNMSQSIESYYQQAGRGGRDRNEARCFVLYCPQSATAPNQVAGGEGASTDENVHVFFHESAFKGPKKEKRIAWDLLRGDARPEAEDHADLEKLLESMEPGASQVVAIDFKNSALTQRMTDYLRNEVDDRFSHGIVRRACDKARKASGFTKKLKWAFKQARDDWPGDYGWDEGPHGQMMERQFERLRDEQDTFKAVYRFSTIGLVEDYTVDYNAGVIRARVRKRRAAGYIGHLQAYIRCYVAPERARDVPEDVLAHDGNTVVQKCLGYLIDFVYSTIANKRRTAIRSMEEAVREGAEYGPEVFRQRISTYFDSKYLPALQKHLRDYSLETVWDFIERTEGGDDNVNHLRGACERLLEDNPDNPVLHLLRAFARGLSADDARDGFRRDFRRGWKLYKDAQKPARQEYLSALNRFHESTAPYDTRFSELLEEEIAHAHASWIADFNQRFLK